MCRLLNVPIRQLVNVPIELWLLKEEFKSCNSLRESGGCFFFSYLPARKSA